MMIMDMKMKDCTLFSCLRKNLIFFRGNIVSNQRLLLQAPGAYQAKEAAKYAYDNEEDYKKNRGKYALKGVLTPLTATVIKKKAEKMAKQGKSKKEIREYLENAGVVELSLVLLNPEQLFLLVDLLVRLPELQVDLVLLLLGELVFMIRSPRIEPKLKKSEK